LGQISYHGTELKTRPPDQKASALPLAPFTSLSWTILAFSVKTIKMAGVQAVGQPQTLVAAAPQVHISPTQPTMLA